MFSAPTAAQAKKNGKNRDRKEARQGGRDSDQRDIRGGRDRKDDDGRRARESRHDGDNDRRRYRQRDGRDDDYYPYYGYDDGYHNKWVAPGPCHVWGPGPKDGLSRPCGHSAFVECLGFRLSSSRAARRTP